jgi:citrate lyase alpha subunit
VVRERVDDDSALEMATTHNVNVITTSAATVQRIALGRLTSKNPSAAVSDIALIGLTAMDRSLAQYGISPHRTN